MPYEAACLKTYYVCSLEKHVFSCTPKLKYIRKLFSKETSFKTHFILSICTYNLRQIGTA